MLTNPSELRRSRRGGEIACLLPLIALLGACGVGERVAQCNQLAHSLNASLQPARAYIAAHPGVTSQQASPEQYQELAALYTALASSLEAAQLDDAKLSQLKADFSLLFEQTAAACADLSTARKYSDSTAKARAERELSRLARREDSLHARTHGYCTSR